MLVLDDCGPAAAARIVISCSVAMITLQLPRASKHLGQGPDQIDWAVTKAERSALFTAFDGIAELVRLLSFWHSCPVQGIKEHLLV